MKPRPLPKTFRDDTRLKDTLYCICRRPDTGKWMIGCDGCDDWFHGECVLLREEDEDLVDQYFCPPCQAENLGITTWKRTCRLPTCNRPALTNLRPPSKYCSSQHGVDFFHSKCQISELGVEEIALLSETAQSASEFRTLGNVIPSSAPTTKAANQNLVLPTESQDTDRQQSQLDNRHVQVTLRLSFLSLVKERQKRVAEELRNESDQTSKMSKEICGFDQRLALDDEDFIGWCRSAEGHAVFDRGQIDGRDNICTKKKCEKHKYWLRIASEDIELEERLISESTAATSAEEQRQTERHRIKALMDE